MNVANPTLTQEERIEAARLWNALMFAPSGDQLRAARQWLKESSQPIRQAVINANVRVWQEGRDPQPGENPFANSPDK